MRFLDLLVVNFPYLPMYLSSSIPRKAKWLNLSLNMWSRSFVAVFMILDVKYVLHKIIGLQMRTQHANYMHNIFQMEMPKTSCVLVQGITVTMLINNIELIVSVRMLLETCNQN